MKHYFYIAAVGEYELYTYILEATTDNAEIAVNGIDSDLHVESFEEVKEVSEAEANEMYNNGKINEWVSLGNMPKGC